MRMTPQTLRRKGRAHESEMATPVDTADFSARLERAEALLRRAYRADGLIGLVLGLDLGDEPADTDALRWVMPALDAAVSREAVEIVLASRREHDSPIRLDDVPSSLPDDRRAALWGEIGVLFSQAPAEWPRSDARLYRATSVTRAGYHWSTDETDAGRLSEDTVVALMLGDLRVFLASELEIAARRR